MKVFYALCRGLFIFLLLGVAALFLVPVLPITGNIDIKIVKSGSMEPAIMTGAVVVVRPQGDYHIGDVVTFQSASADIPTTHRIVEQRAEGNALFYTTKGDANEEADTEESPKTAVIGKVLFSIPYAGYILDFARQPLGFMVLIVLPAFLIVFDEIEKIWREFKKLRSKKEIVGVADLNSNSAVSQETAVDTRPPLRMMEINVPVYPRGYGNKALNAYGHTAILSLPQKRSLPAYVEWCMAALFSVVVSVALVGVGSVGSTVSYFSDTEGTIANALMARFLDFTASADAQTLTFIGTELADNSAVASMIVPLSGSADVLYTMHVETATGTDAFCGAILTHLDSPISYDGPLRDLSFDEALLLGDDWQMFPTLAPDAVFVPGEICVLDIVYQGRDSDSPVGGYSDEERVSLQFTAPIDISGAIVEPFAAPAFLIFSEHGEAELPTEEATTTEDEHASSTPPSEVLDIVSPEAVVPEDIPSANTVEIEDEEVTEETEEVELPIDVEEETIQEETVTEPVVTDTV